MEDNHCQWCSHCCSYCYYSYKNDLGSMRCGKYPDSEHFKNLAEFDQGCRHWICYKEKKEEE